MPGGYLELIAIIGLYTVLVLWPPRRPRALAAAVFFVSHLVNELPGLALVALLADTVLALIGGAVTPAGGLAMLAPAALTALGLLDRWPSLPAGHVGIAWRATCSHPRRCGR